MDSIRMLGTLALALGLAACSQVLSLSREISGPVVEVAVNEVCDAPESLREVYRSEIDTSVGRSRYPGTLVRAVCDDTDARRAVAEICGTWPAACGGDGG